nr:MarR family transcriptional regulator [Coralloluteibacterium stylophorae]
MPYRLSVLSNRISSTIARLYQRRFGLAITEWRVIAVLGVAPGLSGGEVAERTAMDKVAVSRAIAALLGRGLITRELDAGDRRRSVLALSADGRAVYAEIAPLALAFEARLLAEFDAGERTRLDALLGRLEKVELELEAVAAEEDLEAAGAG